MARRPRGRRRDWRQIAFWVISLLVVLSMVMGIVVNILLQPS